MTMATETCATCRFFSTFSSVNANLGTCRRGPPLIAESSRIGSGGMWLHGVFPVMSRGQWCGEHQPRDDAGSQPASEEA